MILTEELSRVTPILIRLPLFSPATRPTKLPSGANSSSSSPPTFISPEKATYSMYASSAIFENRP